MQAIDFGWLVERKTAADLAKSMMDGRYREQKQRLVAGDRFERPMYLLEGLSTEQDLMPSATLEQAIVSTQLRDGLAVLRTTSVHDSVAALAGKKPLKSERKADDVDARDEL